MKQNLRPCLLAMLILSVIMVVGCSVDEQSNAPANSATPPSPQAANTNAPATTTSSIYSGAVDFRDCNEVKGWVWNSADPGASLKTELYIDGRLSDTQPANNLRPDLKIGTKKYGFAMKIPPSSKDGNPHTISVKVAGTEYTVPTIPGLYPTAACKP